MTVIRVPGPTGIPEWRQSARKRAEVAAIATLGLSVRSRAGIDVDVEGQWRRARRRHHAPRGLQPILAVLARPHPARHPLLPAPRHCRDRQRELRRRVDRADTRKFGYGTARGSTSRGGPKALLQLVRDVKAHGVAFTLDGPRGPAEVAQPGAVWLAKATGNRCCRFTPKPRRAGR